MTYVVRLLLVGMVVISPAVTSQPFTQSGTSRRSDFKWNSRKVGNKKIATLTIRKDEERDRRSIPLQNDDEDVAATRPRPHRHRHHHGDRGPEGADGDNRMVASPLFVAESSTLELLSPNDVRLEGGGSQGRSSNRLATILDSLRHTPAVSADALSANDDHHVRPGKTASTKGQKGQKAKRRRRKSSKGCRRLKGRRKKNCRAALRQCRKLKGKERKKCRADAVEGSRNHHTKAAAPRLRGQEACQYHKLRDCSAKVGLLDHAPGNMLPVDKCHYREEFLKCMQERLLSHCDPSTRARGNMTALRMQIRDVVRVGATSSCIVSEVLEG